MSSPSTPPRRIHSSHLHQRSVSRTPSFPTSPPSNRSSPVYSLMRDSPKHPRNRLADSVASASEFVGRRGFKFGKKRDRGGDGGVKRLVVLTVIALGLLVLLERSWNGEDSMFRTGRKMDDFAGLRSMDIKEKERLESVLNQDLAYNQRQAESSQVERPEEPVDRWIRVSRPAPARLDNPSPPPRPSSEFAIVPSAYAFDPSQRFIFVGWMGEQETKAQAHLYQLGLLALATNRTLVLPGVRKSRFGSCYLQNDFTLYYAADTFDRFGIPYITASDFSSWLKQNEETPTAQMVSFARGESVPLAELVATPRHFCLGSSWRLDWTQHEQRAFFISTSDWKSPEIRTNYGEEVVKALLEQDQASVIVVQYNLRFPFLTPDSIASLSPYHFPAPQPYSYFPYSSRWLDLGHAISDQLSPFVAVHWRTETLEVDRIATCGVSLVQELRRIRKEHPAINTLYLATDYPLDLIRNGGHLPKAVVANSGTMGKTLTPAHHDAMRAFLSLLEGETDDDSFHLTTFQEESRQLESLLPAGSGGVEGLDPAIAGLVDKVVLSNAELFFAGLPVSEDHLSGCAKNSQFTTQVITGRKEVLAKAASEDEDTRLWNDVGHFAITGREVDR